MLTKPCKTAGCGGTVEFPMTGGHSVGGQPYKSNGACTTCGTEHYVMVDRQELYDIVDRSRDST